jgi:hypothetical protein
MGLFSKFFLTSPLSLGDWFFSISGSGFVEMFVAASVDPAATAKFCVKEAMLEDVANLTDAVSDLSNGNEIVLIGAPGEASRLRTHAGTAAARPDHTALSKLGLGFGERHCRPLFLWASLAVTAIWLLGVLLGIHLICEGAALGYLAWQVRQS